MGGKDDEPKTFQENYYIKTIQKIWIDPDRWSQSCGTRVGMAAVQGAFMGWFIATAELAWYPDAKLFSHKNTMVPHWDRINNLSYSARYYIRPMSLCTVVTSTYALVECLVEDIRGPEGKATPYYNMGAAGFVTGAMIGALNKRLDWTLATAVGTSMTMMFFGYAGSQEYNREERQKEFVNNVTEHTLKEKYPEYKKL